MPGRPERLARASAWRKVARARSCWPVASCVWPSTAIAWVIIKSSAKARAALRKRWAACSACAYSPRLSSAQHMGYDTQARQ